MAGLLLKIQIILTMLFTTIEILLLVGAIIMPLIPRKVKSNAVPQAPKTTQIELSNFVVTENGKLEELSKSHDTRLSQ